MLRNEPKDSFNRFGDDLTEDILSYLSLEDKFRMECVSKQFQRCVYVKQSDLIIEHSIGNKLQFINLFNNSILDLKSFESLLRKCRFIKTIEINTSFYRITRGLLNLLKHSKESLNSFQEIYINSSLLTPEIAIDFIYKFGPKIKRLNNINFVKSHLNLCPNLYHISVDYITDLFNANQIIVKNLKSISIYRIETNESVDKFQIFIDNNMSLEKLEVNYCSLEDNSFINLLKQFTKCIHLKRLSIVGSINSMSTQMQLLTAIKSFKNLKRIDLRFVPYNISNLIYAKEVQSFGSKSLENWRNVTHLALHLNGICDSFFEDINIYLPNLQSIDILDSGITFKSMECLAKLPKLQTFKLKSFCSTTCGLGQTDIHYLIRKCRKISLIEIRSESNVQQFINFEKIQEIKNNYKF